LYQNLRYSPLAGLASGIEDFCRRVQQGLPAATFAQRRQLVELSIDRVIVTEGDVEIRYVVPASRRAEQTRFCRLRLDYRAGHRALKRVIRPMLGFKSFWAARCTLAGIEVMHMIRKG
jgi:transposase-like protein